MSRFILPRASASRARSRDAERAPSELPDYGIVLHEMTTGFALMEMIFDRRGAPVDFRFLDVNPACESIIGLKLADLRGRRAKEVLPGIDEFWIDTFGRVVLTGEPVLFTSRFEALGKHFEIWASRPSPGRFVVMLQDASSRIASEATALERERLFRSAIQTTSDGFLMMDSLGRAIDVNAAFLAMTGWSREDFLGTSIADHEAAETKAEVREHLAAIRALGHDSFETRIRRKDGSAFDASMTVSFIEDGDGCFVSFCRDVSGRKAAERAAERQASILRAVLNSVDSAVAFKDLDGRYLGCNPEYERVFGMAQAELAGMSDRDVFGPEEAARIRAEDREILDTGRPLEPDLVWRKGPSGHERLFQRRKLPLAGEGGESFGIVVLWHDVGEAYLSKKADFIQIAISLEADTATSMDILRKALDELESATGSESGFFACIADADRSVGRRVGPWAECVRDRVPLIRDGVLVAPVIRDDRCVGVLGVAGKARPYNDWDLALSVRVAETAWEVFERKRAQEKGRDVAVQRDLAISAMRAGLATWHIGEGRKEYDERWAGILGYTVAELPEDSMSTARLLTHPDDYQSATSRMLSYLAGEIENYEAEFRMRHKDGRWIWVLDRALIVERGSGGEPLRVSGLIIDISGLKRVEERLRDALREKDVLLQELFHRTKNTMQLINAMLEMKKQGQNSTLFNQAVETVQGKIIAMALVQEKLYRNGDLSTLDLGEYITELIELIKDSVPLMPANVSIRSETTSVPISVDAAVPCGLIVSELISNALAHAFPHEGGGNIDIAVSRDLDGISISVRDDGVGLPSGFDVRTTPCLGLKTIVGIGEEQLRGRVDFGKASKGFSCRLSFKDVYYPRRF